MAVHDDEQRRPGAADALRRLRPQVGTIARGFDDATTIYAAGDAVNRAQERERGGCYAEEAFRPLRTA